MNETTHSGTGSGGLEEEEKAAADLAALISTHAAELIAAAGGKHLFSAGDVAAVLIDGNGLNLPSVSLNGKTYYDLSFIGRDDAAKVARTAWLKANKEKLRGVLLRK
jgi:hypothetical protein